MSYIPKYILKRLFPADSLANLDTTGDGAVDAFRIVFVNVISPIEIPENFMDEVKQAGVDLADFASFAKIELDGTELPVKMKNVTIWFQGEKFTLDNIESAGGRVIPVGGKLTIVYKYHDEIPVLEPGAHEWKLDVHALDNPMNFSLTRDLKAENDNIKFDPSDT